MIDSKNFANNFNDLTIPDELVSLLDFQNNIAKNGIYSCGFELKVIEEKYGLKTYSEDEQFLNSILEFANADGTGSSYGFWLRNNTQNLNEAPIVVFGGEGGYHIVAASILEFLQILSCDVEPMVSWDKVYYYKDEDDFIASEQSETFKKWLFDNYKIQPPNNPDDIIKTARIKYQEEFANWMKLYYTE